MNQSQVSTIPSTSLLSNSSSTAVLTARNEKSSTIDQFLVACGDQEKNHEPTSKNIKLTIHEELRNYKKSIIEFLNTHTATPDSSLVFWKANYVHFPILSELARGYLSTPGTSICSESAFSMSSYISRKERARLSTDNLAFTMFLKDKIVSNV